MEISPPPSLRFSSSDRPTPTAALAGGLSLRKRIEIAKWPQRPSSYGRDAWTSRGRPGPLEWKCRPVMVICSQRTEGAVVAGRCMDEVYDALAERLMSNATVAASPQSKYIVGLAGPPGSGKSTVASEVAQRVNKLWLQKHSSFVSQRYPLDVATVLPMDGFHLYRSQLEAMDDPEEAHARRGAPWTFNPKLLLKCIKKLRKEGSVYVPSFDHGVGDPVENDIFVSLQHKVVIVEGNYILMEDRDWTEISLLFDEKWFIDVDINKAMQRVLRRHILTGKPPEIARWRIDYNDRPNAEMIMTSKKNADLVISSQKRKIAAAKFVQQMPVNSCNPNCTYGPAMYDVIFPQSCYYDAIIVVAPV
ncbi:hypothetical protein MLD38_020219 [Melastoma candidum]|uniref:Uncharacterized protein n=1 Tax=Melastoma candidum TaxID=119954 RepID=A0ACB9QBR4_9MYRT|nr:hypothetical protein MLD38_020219 [Melastoma candidum]